MKANADCALRPASDARDVRRAESLDLGQPERLAMLIGEIAHRDLQIMPGQHRRLRRFDCGDEQRFVILMLDDAPTPGPDVLQTDVTRDCEDPRKERHVRPIRSAGTMNLKEGVLSEIGRSRRIRPSPQIPLNRPGGVHVEGAKRLLIAFLVPAHEQPQLVVGTSVHTRII